MTTAALVARVRITGPFFARVPAFCVQSGLRYFVLVELIGDDLKMLRVCAFDGTLPSCLPLPGAKFMIHSAPGFVCPGCGGNGQLPFQCQDCRTNGDLLQNCFRAGRADRCACGDDQVITLSPYCVHWPVRGELIAPAVRSVPLLPSSCAERSSSGGEVS